MKLRRRDGEPTTYAAQTRDSDLVLVPTQVGRCPECNGRLVLEVTACDGWTDRLLRDGAGVAVDCTEGHWLGEAVLEKVRRWARRTFRVRQ